MRLKERYFYQFGAFRLDPARRTLSRAGAAVPLAPKAFEMLLLLVENSGRLLEKDELLKTLWPDSVVEEANLSQTVYLLRKALGEGPQETRFIETVPRCGYRFVAAVEEVRDEPPAEAAREFPEADASASGAAREDGKGDDGNKGRPGPPPAAPDSPATPPRRWPARWPAPALGLAAILLAATAFFVFGPARVTEAERPVRSIAVLPFKTLNPAGKDDYLGMGMAEVLVTRLSGIRQLTVQPTNTVRRFHAPEANPVSAGRALQVDAVLEGAIQQAGERLRVTARLLSVTDGRALWTGKFDERFTDIFQVQDSISDQVAEALALTLTSREKDALNKRHTDNTEAYHLYLKGRYSLNKRTAEDLRRAIGLFQRAVELEPDYALAFTGLADGYSLLSISDILPPDEAFPKAKAAAERALAIDPALAEARTSLGRVKWVYEWDWAGAEAEFRRAIELRPNYAAAHDWYGTLLAQRGEFDRALAVLRRAQEADPLSPVVQVHLGWAYFYAGRYDQAVEQYRKVLELEPNYAWARYHLGLAYEQKGMFAEAVAELSRAASLASGRTEYLGGLGHAYAAGGRRDEARRVLSELAAKARGQYVSPFNFALIHAGLGEDEQALEWLRRSVEGRATRAVRLKVDPRFARLRSRPQFTQLLSRLGL
jgi:DNA-binding winged helix-turn-helix (wHTH) protein/TolB-like protein/Tfp pilus assembly protein PilF